MGPRSSCTRWCGGTLRHQRAASPLLRTFTPRRTHPPRPACRLSALALGQRLLQSIRASSHRSHDPAPRRRQGRPMIAFWARRPAALTLAGIAAAILIAIALSALLWFLPIDSFWFVQALAMPVLAATA